MSLGTKINLVLVMVTAVVLSGAFWVIVSIESSNIERQIINSSETISEILRDNITRMFLQINNQQSHAQSIADSLSKVEGVKYINVTGPEGVYSVATDHALVGLKAPQQSLDLIKEVQARGEDAFLKKDAGTFYELEQYIPIRLRENDKESEIINVVEVETATRSESSTDVLNAQKLLKVISASIKQSARSIIVTRMEDIEAIQKITEDVQKFGFFHDFIIFDKHLNIIANTSHNKDEFAGDAEEYIRTRKDVFSGKIAQADYKRVHEGHEVLVKVMPIKFLVDGTSEISGLLEVHIMTSSYKTQINALKLRMVGIGIIFTAVLVIVLAIFLRREIVGPIMRYSSIAQKVSDGDFNQIIEHISDDEIGRFGVVFNSMVSNLREFDRLKSDFISVVAHQLRTPLAGVKWVLKLILDGDLGPISAEQGQMLKRGYDTNEKMIQLVNDLLNVSRIENGKFGYKFEKNDFSKLLNLLIENSQLPSRERNIEVILEKSIATPLFSFDPEKLLIALQNIVDNAVKYTLPGGRVTISTEQQGDYLQIKIKDTGVGIPKDDIHKLFSKFFRAANVIHLQTDGSGLGLFIVKNIIMRHGGQVWVDSIEGKGTTFTIIIPLIDELLPKDMMKEPADSGAIANT